MEIADSSKGVGQGKKAPQYACLGHSSDFCNLASLLCVWHG